MDNFVWQPLDTGILVNDDGGKVLFIADDRLTLVAGDTRIEFHLPNGFRLSMGRSVPAPAMPEPDWTTAPEWANFAIPLLTWSSFEGAMLRWEWYQNEPVWGERAWRWVSGTWGPGKNGSDDAVPVHEVIGMRHMLRQRPQAQEE